MGGEAILADIGALDEAGRDHPPADAALHRAQRQKTGKPRLQERLQPARQPEEGQGQGEDDADAPRQKPVRPFPPIDRLERIEAHAPIDLLILGNALVEFELLLPFAGRERRNDAMDRLPFGDGQARFGQAGRAADDDERDDHDRHHRQPDADGEAIAGERFIGRHIDRFEGGCAHGPVLCLHFRAAASGAWSQAIRPPSRPNETRFAGSQSRKGSKAWPGLP